MTKNKFKENLIEALDSKDMYVKNEDIETFLDLNYDEDGDWDWTYRDFSEFASEVCANFGNFWETVEEYDLHTLAEYEEEN